MLCFSFSIWGKGWHKRSFALRKCNSAASDSFYVLRVLDHTSPNKFPIYQQFIFFLPTLISTFSLQAHISSTHRFSVGRMWRLCWCGQKLRKMLTQIVSLFPPKHCGENVWHISQKKEVKKEGWETNFATAATKRSRYNLKYYKGRAKRPGMSQNKTILIPILILEKNNPLFGFPVLQHFFAMCTLPTL